MFGLSDYSSELTLIIGSKPDQPNAPSTYVIADNVIVEWTAPNSNGAPITSYRISIRQADLTYSQNLNNCDGATSTILQSLSCFIPLTDLTSPPFLLQFGNSVITKIVAINYYGES